MAIVATKTEEDVSAIVDRLDDVHQVFFAKRRDRDIILSVEWSPCKH